MILAVPKKVQNNCSGGPLTMVRLPIQFFRSARLLFPHFHRSALSRMVYLFEFIGIESKALAQLVVYSGYFVQFLVVVWAVSPTPILLYDDMVYSAAVHTACWVMTAIVFVSVWLSSARLCRQWAQLDLYGTWFVRLAALFEQRNLFVMSIVVLGITIKLGSASVLMGIPASVGSLVFALRPLGWRPDIALGIRAVCAATLGVQAYFIISSSSSIWGLSGASYFVQWFQWSGVSFVCMLVFALVVKRLAVIRRVQMNASQLSACISVFAVCCIGQPGVALISARWPSLSSYLPYLLIGSCLMLCVVMRILLWRTCSVESLGYALFWMRAIDIRPGAIWRFFRLNYLFVCSPIMLLTGALLWQMARNPVASVAMMIVVLSFDSLVNELVVARWTQVLPVHRLERVRVASKDGYGTVISGGLVLGATGLITGHYLDESTPMIDLFADSQRALWVVGGLAAVSIVILIGLAMSRKSWFIGLHDNPEMESDYVDRAK